MVNSLSRNYLNNTSSEYLARQTVQAELSNTNSHGLHYYLHSVLPHLQNRNINAFSYTQQGNILTCVGRGGYGGVSLYEALSKLETMTIKHGVAIGLIRNPGKIGALKFYVKDFTKNGNFVFMTKNTARTVGTSFSKTPLVGTNPICVGLPGTDFVFDISTSTIATNKIRLAHKQGVDFDFFIGQDKNGNITKSPGDVLHNEGFLYPFSMGELWYKSFFLSVAIEGLAALAGGLTSKRVGKHKGERLHSKEGMFVIMSNHKHQKGYDSYINELYCLFEDLKYQNFRIPGEDWRKTGIVSVTIEDYQKLKALC